MKIENALGFRPFYAGAGIFAFIAVGYWLFAYRGSLPPGNYLNGMFWHGHEMVFGFAIAVMSGFLLTAVRNWTGLPTPTGLSLAALVLLWILARVLVITGPAMLAALADVLFIPALMIAIAVPIFRSRNQRNYKIVVLLGLLAVSHVVYHMAFLGSFPSWLNHTSVIVAIELITILYALVAGRVIPAFTRNAIPGSDPRHAMWLEVLSFGSLILIAAATVASDWVTVPAMLSMALFVVAAVAHLFRLALWQPQVTLANPLLWMMPVSYSWLPAALLLRALAPTIGDEAWIHALTTGAISGLMLAMMMRSTLGHTGRQLIASRTDISAFLLLQLAAISRVVAAFVPAGAHGKLVVVSGVLWLLAFAAFLLRYLPMLTQPRIDGRPG